MSSRLWRAGMLVLGGAWLVFPAGAQSSFDGTYSGQSAMTADYTHVGSFHCAAMPVRVRVNSGQFGWKIPQIGGPPRDETISVSADGSFKLNAGDYQLSGKIAGGHFVADSTSRFCGYHFDLTKQ
jgi:hypothetical protein